MGSPVFLPSLRSLRGRGACLFALSVRALSLRGRGACLFALFLFALSWNAGARESVQQRRLGYYESLDGFPGLDPTLALALPALVRIDGGTIGCQTAQSYTQWVPMHDPDQALSLLPIGQSERSDHPSRTGTLAIWSEERLHPALLSKEKGEALGVTTYRLRVR